MRRLAWLWLHHRTRHRRVCLPCEENEEILHGHFWATNEALRGATALTLTLTLTLTDITLRHLNPRTNFSPTKERASFRPFGRVYASRDGGARKALPFIRPRLSMEGARLLKSNTNYLYDKTNTQPPSQSVLLEMSQAYK